MHRDRLLAKAAPVVCLIVFACLLAIGPAASAQAWVPPAGAGSVSISSQWISNTGHLLTDGSLRQASQSVNAAIYLETEYAFTDRFSAAFGLPYVFSKFVSKTAPPPIFPFLPVDQCRCWNSGWQDFVFRARYNVIGKSTGGFAVTPSLSVGVPSNDYAYRGEAVVGRNLKEVRIAVDVGKRLDVISRRLSVQGSYSYAIVGRVLDIPNNRSNIFLEPGVQLTRKIYARGILSLQRTHGGLRLGAPNSPLLPPGELNTPERLVQGDRIRRANYFHLGTGVSYSLPRVDVFASYVAFVSGTDTHAGRAFTAGFSWPFELRRAHKR